PLLRAARLELLLLCADRHGVQPRRQRGDPREGVLPPPLRPALGCDDAARRSGDLVRRRRRALRLLRPVAELADRVLPGVSAAPADRGPRRRAVAVRCDRPLPRRAVRVALPDPALVLCHADPLPGLADPGAVSVAARVQPDDRGDRRRTLVAARDLAAE